MAQLPPSLRRTRRIWAVVGIAVLTPVFHFIAREFADRLDLVNHAFFKFWLAGHMIASGLSPYESSAWLGLHEQFGSTWLANGIFLYPPALAYLLQPLAYLPLRTAFIAWGTGVFLCVTVTVFAVAGRWAIEKWLPTTVLLLLACGLYFPVFQTLSNGQMGAPLLLTLCAAALIAGRDNSFWRGALVGLSVLKPSLGVPICGLMGLWMLARRDWPGVAGVVGISGGVVLISFLHDPGWITKFAAENSGQLGTASLRQPTLFNASTALCSASKGCGVVLASTVWLLIFGLCVRLSTSRSKDLDPFAAVALAITWTLTATPYIWPYDYILLVLPFLWITERLIQNEASPVFVAAFWIAMIGIMYGTTPDVAAGGNNYAPNISVPLVTLLAIHVLFVVGSRTRIVPPPAGTDSPEPQEGTYRP